MKKKNQEIKIIIIIAQVWLNILDIAFILMELLLIKHLRKKKQ